MDKMWCNSLNVKANNNLPRAISSISSRKQVTEISSIPLAPLERVYDGCVGGFLALKIRIHLRIATDGSLDGEVRRKQQDEANSIANCNGKKRKRQVIADHPDGIVIAHVVGNAQVVPVVSLSSTINCDGASMVEYCCTFTVMKRLNHVDRRTLTCHLHVPVAPDASAVGTWQFFRVHGSDRQPLDVSSSASTSDTESMTGEESESTEEEKVFQLEPVQWHQHQQEAEQAEKEAAMMQARPQSLLYPLRPGKYEFKGYTTSGTPSVVAAVVPRQRNGRRGRPRPIMTAMKDKCLVTLRLLSDGTLRGTSREVVQPQVCQLKGRWHANRVAYVLEYRVREAVGHFRYSGAVVNEEGGAGLSNGKKTKFKSKANACGKRREMLSGKWHNVDEGHADGYEGGRGEFKLKLVRANFTPIAIRTDKIESAGGISSNFQQKQQQMNQDAGENTVAIDDDDDAICAFTSGEYALSGCATDADGYEYTFDLKVQLLPGGKLLGRSKERIFQQTSPVFGHWGPSQIVYSQQYVVKHEVGVYSYTAELSRDGAVVRGTWANTEADSALASSEHGTLALILVHSTRRWSTFSHSHYPLRFRQGVMTTLMASARMHKLPEALWTQVFAFCSETWFTPLL